ncbi:phage head closure protein [Caloramator proteoclasticus]|uniref:Phage head-tail adaptor, putative, SPP1 family n=1 Tax=Caloramator proteoclasticus DSM 10124 TaxID=1121262 RepID=A0A1M4ZEC7_9CLOT|nr:phage head closure protein [Caloramator proteoclasticus]SHF16394.1 phage head-tail adaptor, putative, SPP1 family [Caloramator proteoclasticus DSM 10124]
MKINDLRHRITLQKLEMVQDSYGQATENWVDVVTVWAAVNPISGREFFQAETINSEVTHKILIRYRKGVEPSMRVKFKDRIFTILSVINFQEKNEALQLMCKELIE